MNPLSTLKSFFGDAIYTVSMTLIAVTAVLWGIYLSGNGIAPLNFILWCLLVTLSSIVIWRAGDFFGPAAEFIEEHHDIPQSVKAAVIDAIASSFPEFAVAIIAVFSLGQAEVGIATVIGSALYNIMVIPAAVGLVAVTPVFVSKEVVWRDNLYYLLVVVVLIGAALLYPTEWGLGVASVFLLVYVGYILLLHHHYKAHKKQLASQGDSESKEENDDDDDEFKITSEKSAWLWILGMMAIMGGASHVLVLASIKLGDMLGIHQVIMAFVVIAAGTSVPDMVISILSAKKGNYDAAISNVFGSNIFDICICLSVPILLALVITGKNTPIELPHTEILWMLLGSTFVALYCFFSNNYTLTKINAWFLAVGYVAIVIASIVINFMPI